MKVYVEERLDIEMQKRSLDSKDREKLKGEFKKQAE